MTALVIALVAVLALIVLGQSGVLPFGKRKPGSDAAAALRELLLARAEGRISGDEFESRQAALHAALLETPSETGTGAGKMLLWAVPAVIALTAAGLYFMLGKPQGIDMAPSNPVAGMGQGTGGAPAMDGKAKANAAGDLNTMVKRLAEKMEKDPNNGEGWLLLARAYGELHQYAQAADAYGKAAALLPPEAGMLADWADSYVMSHERKWDDKARDIVKRALKADPKHLKTLALAGSEAFDRADYKGAIEFWKRMKAAAPADSMDAKLADANMEEATAMMTGKRPAVASASSPASSAPLPDIPPPSAVTGTLTLSPKLKDKVAPGDTVFLVAKSVEGGGPPLAVKRYTVADLPLEFRLDDSAAMMPGRGLSSVDEALLSARISKSGNASPQPGDIASAAVRVKPGSQGIKLELGNL